MRKYQPLHGAVRCSKILWLSLDCATAATPGPTSALGSAAPDRQPSNAGEPLSGSRGQAVPTPRSNKGGLLAEYRPGILMTWL